MMKTLYVGNLPWATTEEELLNAFAAHGEVLGARIISDKMTGRSRGFGFVEVNDEDVEKMIEAMHGRELGGRELVVSEARPRPE
ncbi:MAG: RNA recognition motif domain-containing protein [Limnochordia bacterium]|jgi:RNA recognition motif-containing protein